MLPNASLIDMWPNATLPDMRPNASLIDMWPNATLPDMRPNASLIDMWPNATLPDMGPNASLIDMWPNATLPDMGPNATLNASFPEDKSGYTTAQMIAIGVIVTMVMLLIIIGNIVVIVLFLLGKRVKKPRNAFLVSLAVSDVMVGTLIMPFALANELQGYWAFGEVLCDLWLSFDVMACTASIYNLCAIALDRYWSVTDVAYVQYKNRKRMKVMVTAVWISSFAVGLPPLVGWKEEQDWANEDKPVCELRTLPEYVFFSVALSFWVPLVLMTAVYFVVLRETKKRFTAKLKRRRISKEVCNRYGTSQSKAPDCNTMTTARTGAGKINAQQKPHRSNPVNPIILITHPSVQEESSINEISDYHLNVLYEGVRTESQPSLTVQNSLTDNSNRRSSVCSHKSTAETQTHEVSKPTATLETNNGNREEKVYLSALSNTRKMSADESIMITTAIDSVANGTKSQLSGKVSFLRRKVGAPSMKQETRLNLVIGMVIGAFAVCWLPFFVVYPLSVVSKSSVPEILFKVCFWLGYCNSFLNPFIYSALNTDFREACSEVYRKFFRRVV